MKKRMEMIVLSVYSMLYALFFSLLDFDLVDQYKQVSSFYDGVLNMESMYTFSRWYSLSRYIGILLFVCICCQ